MGRWERNGLEEVGLEKGRTVPQEQHRALGGDSANGRNVESWPGLARAVGRGLCSLRGWTDGQTAARVLQETATFAQLGPDWALQLRCCLERSPAGTQLRAPQPGGRKESR